MKKDLLKLTSELFEKRYKTNDYDGSLYKTIIDTITPTLKPQAASLIQHSNSRQLSAANLNTVPPQQNEKNLSAIDKKIVNIINSNDFTALNSPPHSTIKRVQPHLDSNNYLVNSIKNSTQQPTSAINEENKLKLFDKKRPKKLHHSKPGDSTLPQTTASTTATTTTAATLTTSSAATTKSSAIVSTNKQQNKMQESFNEKAKSTLANDLINTNSNSTTCSSSSSVGSSNIENSSNNQVRKTRMTFYSVDLFNFTFALKTVENIKNFDN